MTDKTPLQTAINALQATPEERLTLEALDEEGAFSAACYWDYGQARLEAGRLLDRIRDGRE